MKARIEKVNVYSDKDVMLVAPAQEMYTFAIFMALMAEDAAKYAKTKQHYGIASEYKNVGKQFHEIKRNIKKEEN